MRMHDARGLGGREGKRRLRCGCVLQRIVQGRAHGFPLQLKLPLYLLRSSHVQR